MARNREPPRPIPTLAALQRGGPHWCWIYCRNALCERMSRPTAIALAPYVIRWGADASSDVLRRRARCSKCGHKSATLMHPSKGSDGPDTYIADISHPANEMIS